MVVEVCGRGAADKRNKKRGIASCSVLSRGTMSQCSLETSYKATQCDASVCLLHPTERLRRKVWRRLGNWNRSVYSTRDSEFLDAYSGTRRHLPQQKSGFFKGLLFGKMTPTQSATFLPCWLTWIIFWATATNHMCTTCNTIPSDRWKRS